MHINPYRSFLVLLLLGWVTLLCDFIAAVSAQAGCTAEDMAIVRHSEHDEAAQKEDGMVKGTAGAFETIHHLAAEAAASAARAHEAVTAATAAAASIVYSESSDDSEDGEARSHSDVHHEKLRRSVASVQRPSSAGISASMCSVVSPGRHSKNAASLMHFVKAPIGEQAPHDCSCRQLVLKPRQLEFCAANPIGHPDRPFFVCAAAPETAVPAEAAASAEIFVGYEPFSLRGEAAAPMCCFDCSSIYRLESVVSRRKSPAHASVSRGKLQPEFSSSERVRAEDLAFVESLAVTEEDEALRDVRGSSTNSCNSAAEEELHVVVPDQPEPGASLPLPQSSSEEQVQKAGSRGGNRSNRSKKSMFRRCIDASRAAFASLQYQALCLFRSMSVLTESLTDNCCMDKRALGLREKENPPRSSRNLQMHRPEGASDCSGTAANDASTSVSASSVERAPSKAAAPHPLSPDSSASGKARGRQEADTAASASSSAFVAVGKTQETPVLSTRFIGADLYQPGPF
ncbi:hypothetical protein cyc_01046 [Cyclospora cayetanensis]|uniref:Transmembrane protein n=1 Tax=Cyclospora cayetanensis TaxID=88456 RepID=A0A1D3DAJ1_9EIME|nr:hypothetical protein cyc_01046 [Cyclospora cayetanensis]